MLVVWLRGSQKFHYKKMHWPFEAGYLVRGQCFLEGKGPGIGLQPRSKGFVLGFLPGPETPCLRVSVQSWDRHKMPRVSMLETLRGSGELEMMERQWKSMEQCVCVCVCV